MSHTPAWRRYARFWRPDVAADVDDELEFHLALCTQELVARGVDPAAARAEAIRRFGSLGEIRDACFTIDQRRLRRANRADTMSALLQDIRYALRVIVRYRTVSVIVILTLALGIGATTAIYGIVDAVMLRPLPYADAGRLVFLQNVNESRNTWPVSYPEFRDWRERSSAAFTELGTWFSADLVLGGGDQPRMLHGHRMTANMPALLGVAPVLGRSFRTDEESRAAPLVIMLNEALWRSRFGADPAILGRVLTLSGQPYTVIGIFPSGPAARLPDELGRDANADFWVPSRLDEQVAPRSLNFLPVVGRLRPGVDLEGARSMMAAVIADLQRTGAPPHGAALVSLRDRVVGDVRPVLLLLFGAVAVLLIIACVNVVNVLLAHAASRGREIAIRAALGAGRRRIIRQLLAESVMRAVLGGLAGIALAYLSIAAVHRFLPLRVPRFDAVRVDWRVLLFAVVLSLATGIAFGLVPAIRASVGGAGEMLRDRAGGALGGLRRDRFRRVLVVAEVALSFTLLVSAGLLLRSFEHLRAVPMGFDADRILTGHITLPSARYPDSVRVRTAWHEITRAVSALPGVRGAALTSSLPVSGGVHGGVPIDGMTFPPGSEPLAEKRVVSAGYFRVLGARIVAGRAIDARDVAGSQPVVVVNEAFVRRWLPGRNPIGQRVEFAWDTHGMQTIVGVVADMKEEALSQPVSPAIYIPVDQRSSFYMELVVRARGDPMSIAGTVRRAVRTVDSELPISEVRTLSDVVAASVAGPRASTMVIGLFALVALVLASVGLYGVISYSVAQRTQELGVRAALGARRGDLLRLVMRQGMGLLLAGLGVGVMAALAASRLIASRLFGVAAWDPATFAGVALLLAAVALLATAIPASRAARMDPLEALRRD